MSLMTSVERILQYTNLPREKLITSHNQPPPSWPSQGQLILKDVNMRYHKDDAPVLKVNWPFILADILVLYYAVALHRIWTCPSSLAGKLGLWDELAPASPPWSRRSSAYSTKVWRARSRSMIGTRARWIWATCAARSPSYRKNRCSFPQVCATIWTRLISTTTWGCGRCCGKSNWTTSHWTMISSTAATTSASARDNLYVWPGPFWRTIACLFSTRPQPILIRSKSQRFFNRYLNI